MRPHFHVAGFPVRIHPLFFLTALATGWGLLQEPARLAVWVAIVFASVLLHELGHALAFRRYGWPARIELHGLGGTTTAEGGARLSHRQSAWVSFAGPASGFVLGGLVWAASHLTSLDQQGGLAGQAVSQLLWVNIGWGLFNLLPMQPLDGGELLASVVRARSGHRYERLLHGVGIVTAVGVLALSVAWRMPWMGLLALMLGVMNFEQLRRLPREQPPLFRRPATPPHRARSGRDKDAASLTVEQLLGELRGPVRAPPSTEGRRASAPVLAPETEEPEAPHDAAVVGHLLLDSGLASLAVRPLQAAFAENPSAATGQALAMALLEAGRTTELTSLLEGPGARHLSDDTLLLIAERAESSGHPAVAARARALHQGRTPKTDEPR